MSRARRFLPLAGLLLALAGCGEPPARPPIAGPEARKAVDAATAAYAKCISDRARAAPLDGRQPGDVVAEAIKACAPVREVLAAEIAKFHRIGHPRLNTEQLRTVANASIAQIEPVLTADAVVAYVSRTRPNRKAD